VTLLIASTILASNPEASAMKAFDLDQRRTRASDGLESFGQIEAIRYTFNAEAPGLNVQIMDLGTQDRPGHL
jgi:hypothetical protein